MDRIANRLDLIKKANLVGSIFYPDANNGSPVLCDWDIKIKDFDEEIYDELNEDVRGKLENVNLISHAYPNGELVFFIQTPNADGEIHLTSQELEVLSQKVIDNVKREQTEVEQMTVIPEGFDKDAFLKTQTQFLKEFEPNVKIFIDETYNLEMDDDEYSLDDYEEETTSLDIPMEDCIER